MLTITAESDIFMMTARRFPRSGKADGAWGRIRTTDTRIFNPLLYQLSYPGISACLQSLPVFISRPPGRFPGSERGYNILFGHVQRLRPLF